MSKQITPTQQRILNVLKDGDTHTREELFECIEDDLSGKSAVQSQVSRLRKIIEPQGLIIDCVYRNRRWLYRLSRHLSSPYNGKKG